MRTVSGHKTPFRSLDSIKFEDVITKEYILMFLSQFLYIPVVCCLYVTSFLSSKILLRFQSTKTQVFSLYPPQSAPNIKFLHGKKRENRIYTEDEMWSGNSGAGEIETFCHPTWEDFYWLKSQTKLPIVMKGILSGVWTRIGLDYFNRILSHGIIKMT